jgi:hypothetical protein
MRTAADCVVTELNSGDEITNGTDPLNSDTDGDGWMMVKKLRWNRSTKIQLQMAME